CSYGYGCIGGSVYSLHQTTDSGYLLAGDSNVELGAEAPLVPWLAKMDGSGAVVWQANVYQSLPSTGPPLASTSPRPRSPRPAPSRSARPRTTPMVAPSSSAFRPMRTGPSAPARRSTRRRP